MMRIIGGEHRSRRIEMPKGVDIRPTQDRVREAVFNLVREVEGANVLDLFAGSGAFGIEALSRGAAYVTFVEHNFRCVETIARNLAALRIGEDRYTIRKGNALLAPEQMAAAGKRFDLIFLDPPYYRDLARKCLINIDAYDIVSPIGRVIVERFKGDELASEHAHLVPGKERRYGDTLITIFTYTS